MSPDMRQVWRGLRSTDNGPTWDDAPEGLRRLVEEAYQAGYQDAQTSPSLTAARLAGHAEGRAEGYSAGFTAGAKDASKALNDRGGGV